MGNKMGDMVRRGVVQVGMLPRNSKGEGEGY